MSRGSGFGRARCGAPHRAIVIAQAAVLTALLSQVLVTAAMAASVVSAGFSGGANTAVVGGTLFAKSGAALTLTVVTDDVTNCVALTGAHTGSANVPTSSGASTRTWTFTMNAATGADGTRTTTVTARDNADCSGGSASTTTSYSVDNTAPALSALFSPTPNVSGWNNADVTLTWSATDTGSGVASGPTPATSTQTVETGGLLKSSTATDRVGNVGNRSMTVKLDKTAPGVTGNRNPAPNSNGWNNTNVTVSFSCSDSRSGISSCSGPTTLSSNGAGQTVTGTANDFASNSSSTTVTVNVDKLAPTISGAPAGSPNAAGWYNTDVTVAWTCVDTGGSGFTAGACANSTTSGEGMGLTVTRSVTDLAGNASNTATSSPAVNVDKTAPVTNPGSVPAGSNTPVTVTLTASDGLSGVASTSFRSDGGATQRYSAANKPSFGGEGSHTLEFWSADNAGNVETHQFLSVGIDTTPPTVNTSKAPVPNANGWNNTDVTVTFSCADASGVATCPVTQVVTTEGADQPVSGTATDTLGNSTTAQTTVSIDKTPPTVSGSTSPAANANGWNNASVTVTFTCSDAMSGVDTCPAPQVFSAEGAAQSASGTAFDNAGNSASATVSNVNVDKTAPSLSGAATTAPNANGWYSGNVTVSWSCGDTLSGLAGACPTVTTVGGEGANLSASASVADQAGNQRSASVTGLRIDRTAPSTSVSVPAPNGNGWYNAAAVVTLSAQDALSGVATTFYTVDGGTAQTYSGPFSVGNGMHTVTFWSADRAGNVESSATGHSVTLRVDNVGPVVTLNGVTAGATYPVGGYAASCSTTDALSGVAAAATLSTSGGPTGAVTLTCSGGVDNAGNGQGGPVSATINVTGGDPPPTDGFKFGGFQWPVSSPPVVNQVRPGELVWVKFSLSGFKGWRIFSEGFPRTWSYTCGTDPGSSPASAAPARAAAFGYWSRLNTYYFAWKTAWSYADSCRVFELKFRDGSTYRALFTFPTRHGHKGDGRGGDGGHTGDGDRKAPHL